MHSRGRTSFFLSLLTRPSPARFRKLEQISFVSTRVIRRITFHSTLLFTSKSLGQKPSVLNTSGRVLPSPNQFDSDDRVGQNAVSFFVPQWPSTGTAIVQRRGR